MPDRPLGSLSDRICRIPALLVLASLFFPCTPLTHARTLYVAQSGDGTDGFSWETAFITIGDALVESASGDAIWVKAGTYRESIVLATGVALFGGFAGTEAETEYGLRDWEANVTTIDPLGFSSSVVTAAPGTTLDGFTITGGYSDVGGGIYCESASILVANCRITGNTAAGDAFGGLGAGIYVIWSEIDIVNCHVTGNDAYGFDPFQGGASGGGIHAYYSTVRISNSVISDNVAAARFSSGGGVKCERSSLTIADCIISGNRIGIPPVLGYYPSSYGGGVYVLSCTVEISRVIISKNMSLGDSAGLRFWESTFLLTNSTIVGNEAQDSAALAVTSGGMPGTFQNCTIAGNFTAGTEETDSVFRFSQDALSLMSGCIIWNNTAPVLLSPSGGPGPIITDSDVQGGYDGVGNISEDPLFVDPAAGDYRLQAGSPCIDSASSEGPAVDLLGSPRPVDIPGFGRDGTGDEYDMGAYEFPPGGYPTPIENRSDINQDGRVDALDVLILQADWHKVTEPR